MVVGLHVPLGDYMARALDGRGPNRHSRAEKALYRLCGVDPDREQSWRHYLTGLLAFSAMGIAALFALFTLQGRLPWSTGHQGMPRRLALHTAVSFHHRHQLAELRGRVGHRASGRDGRPRCPGLRLRGGRSVAAWP